MKRVTDLLSILEAAPRDGRGPNYGHDYNALARRLQAIPRDMFGDPLDQGEDVIVIDARSSFLPDVIMPRVSKGAVIVVVDVATPRNLLDDPDQMAKLFAQMEKVSLFTQPTLSDDIEKAIRAYDEATMGIRDVASGQELVSAYLNGRPLTPELVGAVSAFLRDAAVTASFDDDPCFYEQCYDDEPDGPPPTLDELIREEESLDFLPEWDEQASRDDDEDGGPSMDYMPPQSEQVQRRDGTVFVADIGQGICNWTDLRRVVKRPKPSRRVLLGSPAFDQRIRQLAKSWNCSIDEAEDRFFGFRIDRLGRRIDLSHQRPNHDFPVRRTRQFEE